MGAQIAQAISFAGVPVIITDVNEATIQQGISTVRRIYQVRVDKGKMTSEQLEEKMLLVTGGPGLTEFQEVDLVVEAVPEDLGLKQHVFRELHARCSPGTILASNTSALSISALGASSGRAAKVLGLHFFNPAYAMPLVEIIPGLATDPQTVDDVVGFAESIRKVPIVVKECAGFLVNRLLMVYLNEAVLCLQENAVSHKQIDQDMVAFGMPMGPFTLLDTIGLDISLEVARILYNSYGPRMKPAVLLEQLVQHGRFGVKTGRGFYDYDDASDDELEKLIQVSANESHRPGTLWTPTRLLMAMVNEAVVTLQEGVASANDIDLAMVAGMGFPTSKEGPLHYADDIGIDRVLGDLEEMQHNLGMRFWPAPTLHRMVDAGFTGRKAGHGFFTYGFMCEQSAAYTDSTREEYPA